MAVNENLFNKNLQAPLKLGNLLLKNRVVMSSMSRDRGIVPDALNAEYYQQRSSAGLVLSESVLIEKYGTEFPNSPGIYTEEQVVGWKKVVEAVHSDGGLMFAQLLHPGRASHELLNDGVPPVAPSAIQAKAGKYRTLEGQPGHSTPKAIEDPKFYVQMYKTAAEKAKLACFDGVELHLGNGFLPNQFLESHSNKRTDIYGGSIENRARFSLEIVDALLQVFPKGHVGIKISPSGGYNDMGESTKELIYQTYTYLIQQLNLLEIGYVHFVNYMPAFDPTSRGTPIDIFQLIKQVNGPKVFLVGGVEVEEADQLVKDEVIDGAVFARNFLSNPDLPKRFFNKLNLNQANYFTFYPTSQQTRKIGYTDYPFST